MRSRSATLLCLVLALAAVIPILGHPLPAVRLQADPAPAQIWLPIALRQSLLPRPNATTTGTPGLTVRGRVRVVSPTGPGLAGVAIHLFFASYAPGEVVAVTDEQGNYATRFFYIPGDEMVTVWPELDGYVFDPPHHYWRHYRSVENATRDFVAHRVLSTPSQVPTATCEPM